MEEEQKNKNDTSKHMISETPMHDTHGTTSWDNAPVNDLLGLKNRD
jgi:hypothetical protein